MNTITYVKPKSWKEAEALPFVSFIEKEPNRLDDEPSIWVQLMDDVDNPVTGELGSGFYVCNLYDFLNHYF